MRFDENLSIVTPAKAGAQSLLDSRFRGNDAVSMPIQSERVAL
jgi:hypothetical protein